MRDSTVISMTKLTPLVLLFSAVVVGCQSETGEPATSVEPGPETATGTVTVVFESGNGESKTVKIDDIVEGSSLESVMRSIDDPSIEFSGSGTTAFVNSIGETGTDSTQGWTFTVDGEFANQGIGTTELHPPTTVTWTFGEFKM